MATSNPFFQVPDYSGMFPTIGIDTVTGKRNIDLAAPFKTDSKVDFSDLIAEIKPGFPYVSTTKAEPDTKSSTGDWRERLEEILRYEQARYPLDISRMEDAARIQADLSQEQLLRAYPIMSQAARESTGRQLAASERFLRTKAQMPSAVQAIMESKQGQQLKAQVGESEMMKAVAAQQQAAKDFAGRFAGQYIQVG